MAALTDPQLARLARLEDCVRSLVPLLRRVVELTRRAAPTVAGLRVELTHAEVRELVTLARQVLDGLPLPPREAP